MYHFEMWETEAWETEANEIHNEIKFASGLTWTLLESDDPDMNFIKIWRFIPHK